MFLTSIRLFLKYILTVFEVPHTCLVIDTHLGARYTFQKHEKLQEPAVVLVNI